MDTMDAFVTDINKNMSHLGWFQLGLTFHDTDHDIFSSLKNHTGNIETVQLEYSNFRGNSFKKILDCLVDKRVKKIFLTHCHGIDIDVLVDFIKRNDHIIEILDLDTTSHNTKQIASLIEEGRIKAYNPGSSMGLVTYTYSVESNLEMLNSLQQSQSRSTCYIFTNRILPNESRYNKAFAPKNDTETEIKKKFIDIIELMENKNRLLSYPYSLGDREIKRL